MIIRVWYRTWYRDMLPQLAMCEMVRLHDPFQSRARTPHGETIRALWDTDLAGGEVR